MSLDIWRHSTHVSGVWVTQIDCIIAIPKRKTIIDIKWIKHRPISSTSLLRWLSLCVQVTLHLLNRATTYIYFLFFTLGTLFRPSSERSLWKVDIGTRGKVPPRSSDRKCVVNIATTFNFPSFFKLINNSVIERSDRGGMKWLPMEGHPMS